MTGFFHPSAESLGSEVLQLVPCFASAQHEAQDEKRLVLMRPRDSARFYTTNVRHIWPIQVEVSKYHRIPLHDILVGPSVRGHHLWVGPLRTQVQVQERSW